MAPTPPRAAPTLRRKSLALGSVRDALAPKADQPGQPVRAVKPKAA